jgi:hypothetical protein
VKCMNAQNIGNMGLTFNMVFMFSTVISTSISWYRSDVPTITPHPAVLCINETIHYSNWHLILVEGLVFIMGNGS